MSELTDYMADCALLRLEARINCHAAKEQAAVRYRYAVMLENSERRYATALAGLRTHSILRHWNRSMTGSLANIYAGHLLTHSLRDFGQPRVTLPLKTWRRA